MTREEQVELLATQIAAYCYATAVLRSCSGNYHIYESDLQDKFFVHGFSLANDELRELVMDKLQEYDGVSDIDIYYDKYHEEYDIDLLLWLSYCPQNDEDENYFSSENFDELEDIEEESEGDEYND